MFKLHAVVSSTMTSHAIPLQMSIIPLPSVSCCIYALPVREQQSGYWICGGSIAVLVFRQSLFYLITAPRHKSSDGGNWDMSERIHKLLPSSEKMKILNLIRHFIVSHHHQNGEYSTKRWKCKRPHSYNFYYSILLQLFYTCVQEKRYLQGPVMCMVSGIQWGFLECPPVYKGDCYVFCDQVNCCSQRTEGRNT